MKHIHVTYTLVWMMLSTLISTAIAQVPEGIPYQAVARNIQGQPMGSRQVAIRFSVLDSALTGQAIYVETHVVMTNIVGMFSANIGMGLPAMGTFSAIDWGTHSKFLQVELDTTATGNTYVNIGTQQMMSVPYALYAGKAKVTEGVSNGAILVQPGGIQGQVLTMCAGAPVWTTDGRCPQAPSSCGAFDIHNSGLTYGAVSDQEGNTYKTIIIGNQEWMAENLTASHYSNGDAIPMESDALVWSSLSTGATCWYNNSTGFDCPYGKLYNWYAAADSRNVCPIGWHVPSENDWNQLIKYLDPAADTSCQNCSQSALAGGYMKTTGFQYWVTPNALATNSIGFSGLPAGYRYDNGSFLTAGYGGCWWSSTDGSPTTSWFRNITYYFGDVIQYTFNKNYGFSIRCVKEQ